MSADISQHPSSSSVELRTSSTTSRSMLESNESINKNAPSDISPAVLAPRIPALSLQKSPRNKFSGIWPPDNRGTPPTLQEKSSWDTGRHLGAIPGTESSPPSSHKEKQHANNSTNIATKASFQHDIYQLDASKSLNSALANSSENASKHHKEHPFRLKKLAGHSNSYICSFSKSRKLRLKLYQIHRGWLQENSEWTRVLKERVRILIHLKHEFLRNNHNDVILAEEDTQTKRISFRELSHLDNLSSQFVADSSSNKNSKNHFLCGISSTGTATTRFESWKKSHYSKMCLPEFMILHLGISIALVLKYLHKHHVSHCNLSSQSLLIIGDWKRSSDDFLLPHLQVDKLSMEFIENPPSDGHFSQNDTKALGGLLKSWIERPFNEASQCKVYSQIDNLARHLSEGSINSWSAVICTMCELYQICTLETHPSVVKDSLRRRCQKAASAFYKKRRSRSMSACIPPTTVSASSSPKSNLDSPHSHPSLSPKSDRNGESVPSLPKLKVEDSLLRKRRNQRSSSLTLSHKKSPWKRDSYKLSMHLPGKTPRSSLSDPSKSSVSKLSVSPKNKKTNRSSEVKTHVYPVPSKSKSTDSNWKKSAIEDLICSNGDTLRNWSRESKRDNADDLISIAISESTTTPSHPTNIRISKTKKLYQNSSSKYRSSKGKWTFEPHRHSVLGTIVNKLKEAREKALLESHQLCENISRSHVIELLNDMESISRDENVLLLSPAFEQQRIEYLHPLEQALWDRAETSDTQIYIPLYLQLSHIDPNLGTTSTGRVLYKHFIRQYLETYLSAAEIEYLLTNTFVTICMFLVGDSLEEKSLLACYHLEHELSQLNNKKCIITLPAVMHNQNTATVQLLKQQASEIFGNATVKSRNIF